MSDVIGFVSIGFLIIVQIIAIAFFMGKMFQGLKDLTRRVTLLESCYKSDSNLQEKEIHEIQGKVIRLEAERDVIKIKVEN